MTQKYAIKGGDGRERMFVWVLADERGDGGGEGINTHYDGLLAFKSPQ